MYGIVREMLDVAGLVRNFLFSASLMVCHGRFSRGRILRVAIALREGLLWFGSYYSALSKEQFSSISANIANY